MTGPRHLWSGDWERESAAAAEEGAERRAPAEAPPEPQAPAPSPARPSVLARAYRALREADPRQIRRVALAGLAGLAVAAAAYGVISALQPSPTSSLPAAASTSVSTSRAAWLGVDTTSFPVITGALIVDVASGSPADAAGLQPGDVIIGIDNHPVQTPADLNSTLAGTHAGQRVQIEYQLAPGQSTHTTQAVLQSSPGGP